MDAAHSGDADAAVTALVDLIEQLERTSAELASAVERAHEIVALREDGRSWQEIVSDEERPLIIERVSRVLAELGTAGNRVRREQARALMREDLTVTAVSKLFGVTRQRISILVQDESAEGPDR
ncbi:hypothetical protein [Pseudonocardia endophytica]|uniref:Homeodomain-like domain-containing protein n=1 Tax=Pseudonocardia endophytica TaxID=401976 RepID=A0A4R1HIX2_PSEEN|nr:hypothetical protein [Pseudonocardia endophytica]TCK21778.1 hypothetical protein EV378_5769 [Pseudonocardia endophytica]